MFKRAEQVIELGWAAGCRHPDLADAYAGQLAASGRLASYDRAIDVCDEALDVADGNPMPARRHHPVKPRRTRPMCFVDVGRVGGPNQPDTSP